MKERIICKNGKIIDEDDINVEFEDIGDDVKIID